MPEYLVGILISTCLATIGVINRRIDNLNVKVEDHKMKVAEHYVTKTEVAQNFERLFEMLIRLEDKVDAHVSEEPRKISRIKQKYNL